MINNLLISIWSVLQDKSGIPLASKDGVKVELLPDNAMSSVSDIGKTNLTSDIVLSYNKIWWSNCNQNSLKDTVFCFYIILICSNLTMQVITTCQEYSQNLTKSTSLSSLYNMYSRWDWLRFFFSKNHYPKFLVA